MQRSLLARLATSVAVLALVLGACSSPAGGSAAPTTATGMIGTFNSKLSRMNPV